MDQQLLITAVEKRPALYDKTDKNYSNRNFITAEWKKIAEEVGCTDNDARKRWTKLRDYFRKTHAEMTSQKSGSVGGKKKRWYLYDNMLFVLPHLADRKTQSNLSSSEDETAANFEEASQASASSYSFSTINSPAQSLLARTPTPTPDAGNPNEPDEQIFTNPRPQNQRVPRRPRYPQERQAVNLDAEMIEAIKGLSQNQDNNMNNDEDLIFFKGLVPKMKLLDPAAKMECQYEIHTLVMRYIRNRNAQFSASQLPPNRMVSPQPGTSTDYTTNQGSASGSPPGGYVVN